MVRSVPVAREYDFASAWEPSRPATIYSVFLGEIDGVGTVGVHQTYIVIHLDQDVGVLEGYLGAVGRPGRLSVVLRNVIDFPNISSVGLHAMDGLLITGRRVALFFFDEHYIAALAGKGCLDLL